MVLSGLCNGLAPKRLKAIAIIKDNDDYWNHMALLDYNE